MKAKRVKSLIALLLVLAMMLPTMPFSYADPPAQPKMLDKQKISGPDAQGNYTIKLTVEDTGRPQKHDIVIVFDVSLSMIEDGAGKFNQAKTGAIKFAETLLAGSLKNYNRIAVVSFADKVYAQQNFTNNIDTIKNVINGLQLNENTNIQAGLHKAGEYLKLSKADHKQILLLSDGGPDACYDLKKDTELLYYGEDFQVAGPNSAAKRYKRDYESKAYLAVERMNYNRLVKNGEVANTTKGMVKIADGTRQKAMVDPANQTYSEAKFLKDSMVTIRVIGYEVDEQTKAQLKEIASENSFYEAGVGQIEDLLAGIGQNFASYKNVKVTDPIGPLFELVTKKGDRPVKATDAITDIVTLENLNGQGVTTAALSADLRTITWTIGTLNGKATMEYKVRLKPGYEGMENNTDNLAMNGNTGFGYDGGSLAFPVPQVPINKVVYKSELPSFYSKAYNYLIKQERDVKGIGDISMPQMPPGKIFVGWKEASTGETLYQKGFKLALGKSYEFTAVWKNNPDIYADALAEVQGGGGTVTAGPAIVEYGKTKLSDIITSTFKPAPAADYLVDKWFIKKGGKLTEIQATHVFKKTDCEVPGRIDLVVTFKKDPTKWATITAESSNINYGTVTGAPLDVKKSTTWGAILQKNHFSADPKDPSKHKFVGWKIQDSPDFLNNDSPINGNVTVVAVFELLKDIKVNVTIEGQGTVGPNNTTTSTTATVKEGTHWRDVKEHFKVQKPGAGYKFDGFYVVVAGQRVKLDPATNDYKFNDTTQIFAVFVKDSEQKEQLTVVVIPEVGKNTLTGSPAQVLVADTWADIMKNPPFTLTLKPGYEIAKWTLDEAGNTLIPDTHKFTKTTTGTKVYAHLREKAGEWFTITVQTGPNGKLEPGSPTTLKVHKDTPWSEIVGKFRPVGNDGYKPGTWTYVPGDGPVNPGDKFNTNKTVKINFVPDDAQKVLVTAVGLPNEMLERINDNPQSVYKFETWAQIKDRFKVVAKTGYEPYKWTFDQQGKNEIPVSHKFTSATTVYVHLREKAGEWFDVTAKAGPNGKLKDGTPTKVRVHKNTPWSQIVGKFSPEGNEGYKPGTWTYFPGTTVVKDGDTFSQPKTVQINFVPDDAQNVDVTLVALPTDKAKVTNSPQSVRKFEKWSEIKGRFTVTEVKGYEAYKYTYDAEGKNVIGENDTFKAKTTIYVHLREKAGEWFTINAIANPNGKLDTNPPAVTTVRVHKDTPWSQIVASFKPIPDKGFKIGPWTHKEDGSSPIADTYKFTKDETVYVNFLKDDGQYSTIHAKVYNNEGGSVAPAQYDFFKDDTYAKAYDYFNAKEAKGYVFSGWVFADGKSITKDNTTQVVPGDTVYAKFLKDTGEFVKISARSKGNGTVTGDPVDVLKGTTWDELQKPILPFEHKAAPGFKFDKWTFEDGSDIPTRHNFMVNTVIFANFVKDGDKTLEVTAKVYLDDGGTVTPEKDEFIDGETYDKLSTKFKPKEKDGYSFTGWVDKDGKTLNPNAKIKNGDVVYAKFGKLHGQWLKLNVIAVGEGEVKPEEKLLLKDTATGKSQFAWAAFKDDIKAYPKLGFKLKGDVLYLDEQGLNPVPDDQTFNDGDKVYALFERDDDAHMNVLAEADPVAGGTATPPVKNILKGTKWSEIRTDYDAKANPGFTFLGWFVKDTDQPLPKLGDDETLVPDYTFNAPEVTIQARYQENTDEWIWVTPKSKGGGKILVGPAKVYKGSTWEQIDNRFTVSSDPGYRFTHWTEMNGNRLVDTYVFNVIQDIFAHFEAIPAPTPPSPSPGNDRGDDSTDGRGGYQEYNPGPGRDPGNTDNNKPKDEIIEEEDVAKGVLNYNDFYAYIQGYPDGSVRSSAYVNREETAAIFFRLLEPTYKESIRSVNNNFKDITASTWSNKHISTLANGGIIKGYSDGTFRPRAPITRAELAVIAAKFDRLNNNNNHGFKDVNGHWAERYIANANQKGWIKGYPNGEFRPDKPITRAEFVTFVNKVLGRNVKKPEIPQGVRRFTDLKADAWYYENMVTATNSYLATQGNDGFQKWSKLVNIFIEM